MNKKRKSFVRVMLCRTFCVSLMFFYGCFLCSGNTKTVNKVSNMNGARSVSVYNLIVKHKEEKKKLVVVETMDDAALYGPDYPIAFVGQMTAYKATCKGCTGRVSCPPSQDVRNDNIWYEDSSYGKIRILAADKNIPCGTIVKVTNVSFSTEPITGIVLDRGGAIKGNIMDFLVGESDDMDIVGRQRGVNYEVLRWGW